MANRAARAPRHERRLRRAIDRLRADSLADGGSNGIFPPGDPGTIPGVPTGDFVIYPLVLDGTPKITIWSDGNNVDEGIVIWFIVSDASAGGSWQIQNTFVYNGASYSALTFSAKDQSICIISLRSEDGGTKWHVWGVPNGVALS